ncbi:sensor histidine kinase/response regulator [Pseudomonas fluorescens]|uniref:histidine kinase n=1 Tax=Pseudomonas fluorescens TaxID=294 RepID=A0A379IE23_PSEFL|nr:hybrid sensor histidine kinase/response regulator [Pseudomonas fluorescens]AIG01295.1 chemotaxis protein CheY [Pseudomonas fluorescens]SUD31049.1 sensor histidine kinase/response regulator [Pseudomonas fluorescens]
MKHNNAILEAFTRSSLRLNKGLMVVLGVALLLAGTSYWALARIIDEQRAAVAFHFARLMENIQEQEAFLRNLTQPLIQRELVSDKNVQASLKGQWLDAHNTRYEGREFAFSVPFSAQFDAQRLTAGEQQKLFALGAHLASYYSAFWSSSPYASPHTFIFNRLVNYHMAVPAVGYQRGGKTPFNGPSAEQAYAVQQRLGQLPRVDDRLYWEAYAPSGNASAAPQLLAYIGVTLSPQVLRAEQGRNQVMVATLLDMAHVNDVERTMASSIYDRFTLIAPAGQTLTGPQVQASSLGDGLNFRADGLEFKITHNAESQWTAIYGISYKHFFRYALWPLTSLALFLCTVLAIVWAGNRWYRRQVVYPARQAHERIAESVAFSRVIIDTAPTGLCVVGRADGQVLIENQRAQQWPGTARLVAALSRSHDNADSGETHLEIEGRHLQVGFVSTRYQGQDVRLYAFSDVTRHIEDAAALEEARRAADAANEAKTLFLATMSHEIRTPLYGVLGTLELLGLTPLDPRQKTYLHTIQRSSATLFQLISDVLDVSKIESGQMAIESIEFCPLDMLEDTLHTYAAFAQRKGLQLYGCIDAQLPDCVVGDPMRIRQILNNLVSNALKFTDIGRVVIRARAIRRSPESVDLEWQVTDSGVGISQAQQAKLFDVFYQAPDTAGQGGAGLGLPICRWLAEMMDGQIKVVSEPGLGSSFTLKMNLPAGHGELPGLVPIEPSTTPVYVQAPVRELAESLCAWLGRLGIQASVAALPLAQQSTQAVLVDVLPATPLLPWAGPRVLCVPGAHSPPLHSASGWEVDMHDVRAIASVVALTQQGKQEAVLHTEQQSAGQLDLRILVAEDNPVNQAIIQEQLQALGCTVTLADNGEQAMHLWQPQAFDLVLTDVNMPLMNGYELARTLREHDPHLPIIGVTANAMREEGMRCLAVGMNAWLVKPLSLQTLRAQLIKLCKPTARAAPPVIDTVQMSDKMRPLFISSVQHDLQRISAALEQRDGRRLAEILHSTAGALGAVQALGLAQACIELESQLAAGRLNNTLEQQIKHVMTRLSALLGAPP